MKQYLLVCNEATLAAFKSVFGLSLEYVEVAGMDLTGNSAFKLLVAPVQPPIAPMEGQPPLDDGQAEPPQQAADAPVEQPADSSPAQEAANASQ